MEGLDPTVEDLGLASELRDVGHLDPGLSDRTRRAPGREDLDSLASQAPGEVHYSGLVGDRDQGPCHLDRPVGRIHVVHLGRFTLLAR